MKVKALGIALPLLLLAAGGYAEDMTLDNFESGAEGRWKWSVGDASVSVPSEGAKEGASCLKIEIGAKEGKSGIAQVGWPKGVKDFEKIVFWCKGDGSDNKFRVVLNQSEDGGMDTFISKEAFTTIDAVWHKVEINKADFARAHYSKAGNGVLKPGRIVNFQFRDEWPGPKEAFTIFIDDIKLVGVSASASAAPKPAKAAAPKANPETQQPKSLAAEWKTAANPPLKVHRDSSRLYSILNGVWDFKPLKAAQELDCTKEVKLDASSGWDRIKVPSHWDDFHEYAYPASWADCHQAWYRLKFKIPEEFKGRRVHLRFSAVAYNCQIFLNGSKIGGHWGAWTPFEIDATGIAKPGEENELQVFVADLKSVLKGDYDLSAIAGWGYINYLRVQNATLAWTVGEVPKRRGIWQDVFIVGQEPAYASDAFVKTSWREKKIDVEVELKNEGASAKSVDVSCEVRPSESAPERASWSYEATKPGAAVELGFPSQRIDLKAGESRSVKFSLPWASPKLWEPGSPKLYYLLTKVKDGSVEDVKETRFGFREVWVEGVNLILNGKPVHILGNTAHSAHSLSLICNRRYWEASLAADMRELNFNGLRLMSEVPYPVMSAVCDELGLMVIEQSSNWASPGYNANYLRAGDEFIRNLAVEYAEWIKRERNRPSILVWCPQNEGSDEERFLYQLKAMRENILKHDTTRPVEFDGLGRCKGLADLAAIHYSWQESEEGWDRSMPLGCVEQTTKKMTTGDAPSLPESGITDPIYREILFSFGFQRLKGYYAVLPFSFARPRGIFTSVFKDVPETPLRWSPEEELYPKPDHSTTWCHGGASVNIWDESKPKYAVNPVTGAAFKKVFSPLFAGILEEGIAFASGQSYKNTVSAVNDTRAAQSLTLCVSVEAKGVKAKAFEKALTLDAGAIANEPLDFVLPDVPEVSPACFKVELLDKGGKSVFQDALPFTLYPRKSLEAPSIKKSFALHDSSGETAKILSQAGVKFEKADFRSLDPAKPLLIGRNTGREELQKNSEAVLDYVRKGGRIVVFEQEEGADKWLPANLPSFYASGSRKANPELFIKESGEAGRDMAAIDSLSHPVFKGVSGELLRRWPHSSNGLLIGAKAFFRPLEYTVVGNFRSLVSANANPRFEDSRVSGLLEMPFGKGSIILSQLKLHDNYRRSPEATLILHNLLSYAASDAPILASRDSFVFVGDEVSGIARDRGFEGVSGNALPARLAPFKAIFIGSSAADLKGRDAERLKMFVEGGGVAVIELPQKETKLPFIREGLASVEDKGFFKILKSRMDGQGKDWWGEGEKAVSFADRMELFQGLASEDLVPAKNSLESAFVVSGLGVSDIRVSNPAALVAIPHGKGLFVVSSLRILSGEGQRERFIWHTLATNLGMPLSTSAVATSKDTASDGREHYKIVKAGELEVDGDLKEWTFVKGEAGAMNNWRRANPIVISSKDVSDEQCKASSGDKDKSAVAYMMWDESSLYIAMKVVDDFVYDKGGSYNGDAFELCLGKAKLTIDIEGDSFNLYGGESEGVKIPKGKVKYALRRVKDMSAERDADLISSRNGASLKGAPGYIVEMALPMDYLPMIFPLKQGTKFGMGLALDDNDGSGRELQIAWPKGWYFSKPDTWGIAELSDGN